MTKSLEDAFNEAAKLPRHEQEQFAAFIKEELASEQRWTEALSRSQDQLAALADEALAEHRRGETKPFEADRDLAHD